MKGSFNMRIGGIASGIDTHQMIDDLMRAERIPLDRIFQRRQWVEWQQDAYRDLNLAMSKFRDSHEKLRLQSTFNAFGATSSNPQGVTAVARGNAMLGNYSVTVDKLAKAASLTSKNELTNLDGNKAKATDKVLNSSETEIFTITMGDGRVAQIEVDDTTTFSELASKISKAVDVDGNSLGLQANFDETTGRFFISTKELGGDKKITIQQTTFTQDRLIGSVDSADFEATGQYGKVTLDGIGADNLTSNKVTINGIELTLIEEGASATISVNSDADKVVEDIKSFVEEYNGLIADLQAQLNEPRHRDFPALTDEQRREMSDKDIEMWEKKAKSGLLRGDDLVRGILNDLRRSLSDPVKGIPNGEINMLSQIGITTSKDWRLGGMLEIDEDKLRQALTEKPDEVRNLFTQRAEDGTVGVNEKESDYMGLGFRIQANLNDTINKLRSKAGMSGSTASTDQSNLGKQLSRFDDQIIRFERRLSMVEDRYWRQFTAMEKAMAQMNSQSAWMMETMFGGMNQ